MKLFVTLCADDMLGMLRYLIARLSIPVVLSLICFMQVAQADSVDPHNTPSGFFDVHLCNWPNRPPFYMALYSTTEYDKIKSVSVFDAEGELLGMLDMDKFMLLKRDGKPDKRVFISHYDMSADAKDGWFTATVELGQDEQHRARDYVIHYTMPRVKRAFPGNNSEAVQLPVTFKWDPIEEAAYYQVFIKDQWQDGKVIYTSELLEQPELKMSPGVLEAGGYYSWKIHARDVNEHLQLGDFNMGSNSEWFEFSVADD